MWAFLVAVVLQVISYMLTPKPKAAKPGFAQDEQTPTSDAARPIPVVFGTVLLRSPNVLWYGDQCVNEYDTWA